MIHRLASLFTEKNKKQILGLLFFSIFVSIIETAGVSVIMPFISVATDFSLITSNEYYVYIYNFFGFETESSFVVLFGISLIVFYVLRSLINIFYYYLLNDFTQMKYFDLSSRLFKRYMTMSYKDFATYNTSSMTKNIVNEATYLTNIISAVLLMLSEIFVILFIYGIMIYVNYKITILVTLILMINALFMIKTISKKIKAAGAVRESFQKKFYEILNRSFGNFKLIKLNKNKENVLVNFDVSCKKFADSNATYGTLRQVPRLFLESVAFSLVVLIVTYLIWKDENTTNILPIVSMFIVALYRLMPSVNRIMNGYNTALFNYKSLDIIYQDLMIEVEKTGDSKISLGETIDLKDIGFSYDNKKQILDSISLTIKKNSKIAFIGDSGSGKSTLVNIIIGLYSPQQGTLSTNEQVIDFNNVESWRSKVGYIPQSIYLFDGTVGENIAFGFEYDAHKIDECLKKARIYDFLITKEGKDTIVGEGGIMLSGGQKQRIAIARALYLNPDILILDEATSALDTDIEEEIMNEIYTISQNKTLIIIAHRLSTLDKCEKIYKLENGKLINA